MIAHWDCGLIPFKRTPLTEATNPVKVYEMLAAGKAVVAVDLPELRPIAAEGLIEIATDARGFAEKIELCRREQRGEGGPATCLRPREHLGTAVLVHGGGLPPAAPAGEHRGLDAQQPRAEPALRREHFPAHGLAQLRAGAGRQRIDRRQPQIPEELAAAHENVTLLRNDRNESFARANNQGVTASSGEFVVLLNNDTIVTRGWLTGCSATSARSDDRPHRSGDELHRQ